MKNVILDTSFIINCMRQRIDFLEELRFMGFEILIPKEVIDELKGLSKSKSEAEVALRLLRGGGIKKIELHSKNVDKGIINYAKKHDVIVASLDKGVKDEVKKKVIIRGKKRLELL